MAGRVRVSVGEVDVRFEGPVSVKQLRALMRLACELNLRCAVVSEPSEVQQQVFGFGAQVERFPEEIPREDLSWYFDE